MKKPDPLFFDWADLAHVGKDAIIGATVRIRKPERFRIGDCSIVDDFTYISCGLSIGSYTHLGANGSVIGGEGHVTIGDFVNIAPGCRLISASNDFTAGGLTGPAIPARYSTSSIIDPITIDHHVLLGTGTVVLPGTHVPEGVATGAMTLLTPSVKLEPWTLYVGQPARPLRARECKKTLSDAEQLLREMHAE